MKVNFKAVFPPDDFTSLETVYFLPTLSPGLKKVLNP